MKYVWIGTGSLLLLFALTYAGYRGYQRWFPVDPDADLKKREVVLQKQIALYEAEIKKADVELQQAKKASAVFYEQSIINARNAATWRARYVTAVNERDALKRALTGQEAIIEMRKLGYLK